MNNPKENESNTFDEVTEEFDLSDVTPVSGGILIDLEYEATPDTAKIITDEASIALRLDSAYTSGFNEGFLHGQIKILETAHQILIRAGNSLDDATEITKVIAKHSNILNVYEHWLLTHKNNY